jgi:hypothetical protein
MNYLEIVKKSNSKSNFAKNIGYKFYNGKIGAVINGIIKKYKLNISHFKTGGGHNIKYKFVEKKCPSCNKLFTTQSGGCNKKITCGHSCSNKFFASKRVPDKNLKHYTTLCFRYHKKQCIICGENKIVAVHHYDENKKNNNPENLIPMCPTHHQYWHSRYKHIIYNKVVKYRESFIKNNR